MKDLFSDTKDIIERKWARMIDKKFPAYALFWNEFIGVRTKTSSQILLPYKYQFPSTWTSIAKKKYLQDLEELAMAHYSLFCNLAGAHFQIDECVASLGLAEDEERHFHYWESFEVCYQHMGNAINYFYLFWDKIFALTNNPIRRNTNGDLNKTTVSNAIENYFRSQRKYSLHKKLKQEFGRKGQIVIIRNNTVHFARVASWSLSTNGRVFYFLPYKLQSNTRWTKKTKVKKGIMADKKAVKHLSELEVLLNLSEELAIKKLRTYLQTEGISIKYT